MTTLLRALRRIVRNWPLKLGAVALATVLYAGLVVSQNARLVSVRVPIEPIGQPGGAFLLEALPAVTSIRFYAPADVASRIGSADFRALVDLRDVSPTAGGVPQTEPVVLESLDERVRIIDYEPRMVTVRLDPVEDKVVPVEVQQGSIPSGLEVSDPQVEPDEVRVRGPSSLVARVVRAIATVPNDPTAIDVDQDVDVVPVDERNEPVAPVDVEPARVRIRIHVGTLAVTRSVPVQVNYTGVPAPGYSVRQAAATPVAVTILGPAGTVGGVRAIPTGTVDLAGRSTTLTTTVELVPPEGVTILGETSVQVRIVIAADTGTRSIPVGLTLLNARSDRTYHLSATDAIVTLKGTVPALNALDASAVTATVDVASLPPGSRSVNVGFTAPAGLQLVSINPTQVTVTVGLPPTPPPTAAPPPPTAAAPTPTPRPAATASPSGP